MYKYEMITQGQAGWSGAFMVPVMISTSDTSVIASSLVLTLLCFCKVRYRPLVGIPHGMQKLGSRRAAFSVLKHILFPLEFKKKFRAY